jgi:hypothetical protein
MASFASAKLDHELLDKFVTFKVGMKLNFDPNEIGHPWLVQIEFWEQDPFKDDRLWPLPKGVRVGEIHEGQWRHYIEPSSQEIDLDYEAEFPEHHVNTEPGKEEVYAVIKLRPVDPPPDFLSAETRTNITKVNV